MKEATKLILKYLDGKVTSVEQEHLEKWVMKSSENKNEFIRIKSIWAAGKALGTDNQKSWDAIEEEIEKRIFRIPKFAYRAAAILILVVSMGLIINQLIQQSTEEELNKVISISANMSRKSIVLPDSSIITLNKESEIKYSNDFKERVVKFNGLGFFVIREQKNKPFTVITDSMMVNVLGTSFSVSTQDKAGYSVSVQSGSVKVSGSEEHEFQIIKDDEKAIVDKGKVKRSIIDDPNIFSWKTGIFEFNTTPLIEVAKRLEKHYHIQIQFDNLYLTNCTITARFDNNSIEDIITLLQDSHPFIITYQNSKMTIYGTSC